MIRKIIDFFGICCWAVGVIGGFGYAAYNGAWFIAVCVLVLGVLSFDKLREFVRDLTS